MKRKRKENVCELMEQPPPPHKTGLLHPRRPLPLPYPPHRRGPPFGDAVSQLLPRYESQLRATEHLDHPSCRRVASLQLVGPSRFGRQAGAAAARSNGFIRVDCFGGLNQMRRDLCDGIGIARLLNATLVLPKFEVAAYWNESSGFADVFDVDYFVRQTEGYVEVAKELPEEIASREPFRVDCSKRKGLFDYVESVLPALLEHRYISITPAISQRRDRYPLYAKAAPAKLATTASASTRPWNPKRWSSSMPSQSLSFPYISDSNLTW
ncbi:uncharacterized protein M6B38_190625 [Iris pallida]|uniref:O-fucosyltransferase family protein n=1 Tax=Iris pallida TaxID=29817 RepID=A0AAX6EFX6_IRIPA|nr:uncharacterized protein M6B38_190625 [Iris pallida]